MCILIVDDYTGGANTLQAVLAAQNFQSQTAPDGRAAIDLIATQHFDVMILDVNLADMDGFDVLRKARALCPELKIIIVSGSLGVSETVEAMKLGAHHCFAKPLVHNELIEMLKKLDATKTARTQPQTPAAESQSEMVAVSRPMMEVTRGLRSIAKGKTTTVLITGETGTGKEVVARRLHRLSSRRDKPFVAVNCSAIPASLIESELFGHEKGAFTDARATRKGYFEAAGEGTIFLDEIGDLSLELQSKLLRVLQERSFRRVGGTVEIPLQARVVAATNVDLAAAVRAGKFREDLYYRLAVIPVHLLPLRQRTEDILPLAEGFVRQVAMELNVEPPLLNEEHKQALLSHPWSGNVRELRNVIERFVLMGGQLEFVSSARIFKDGQPEPIETPDNNNKEEASAIASAERKMIYSLLIKELLGAENAGKSGLERLAAPLVNKM